MNGKEILTSVKVSIDDFETFKVACIRNKFSLHKLVTRAMNLYIHDEEFRSKLHNHNL